MHTGFKAPLLNAVIGALFLIAPTSEATALSAATDLSEQGASPSSLVQQVSHGAPAGTRCMKWTRRWNTRHGFGHRRCVQWR
jgi:hypothetical protein